MSRPAFIALADDLTGAAELAAIGRRMGLHSVICTEGERASHRAELVVHDTDSRLCTATEAARRVRTTLEAVRGRDPGASIFKKVDSVLRGPVAAELVAAATALGKSRVLLVPANPSLGRTLRDGTYRIDGVPLDETAFAHDPHHPALSSRVLDMLGPVTDLLASSVAPACASLPVGIVLGDATCIEDMDTWAGRLGDGTLAAGGADFFSAWLRNRGCNQLPRSAFPHLGAPVLLIAGSTAPAGRAHLAAAAAAGTAVVP
ncbi:MAG TPA: four-carbon acid sugar kinase family protein, partial [Opitutaceae bacterium]